MPSIESVNGEIKYSHLGQGTLKQSREAIKKRAVSTSLPDGTMDFWTGPNSKYSKDSALNTCNLLQ